MNQITMGLLFLQLLNYTDRIQAGRTSFEQEILIQVYQYVEEHYKDGELTSLAARLHCDFNLAVTGPSAFFPAAPTQSWFKKSG